MPRSSKDIAIVGAACRFPGGVETPDAFWDLLVTGTDAVTRIPEDRFDQHLFLHPGASEPGKSYTFAAGTLGDVAGFDAGFFGISPREAAQIDPQQRLLLEMAWEALERGGQVPEHLAGTPCAVYVGVSSTDYADLRQADPASANAYFMLGSTLSIAANRLSYAFDLRGPSMAIDTACSSALVALHEAVHALREGRAPMAIVGAVNLLLSPYPFIGFAQAGMLAPDGRCRAFAKSGKGYVRAEGGGVAVLKPLAAAEREGDPILAVIRGIGVSADGRTQGIALPSSDVQEALLRQVYRAARIAPQRVSYIEAHGTGTAAGDPAEAGAIGRAIALRRPKSQKLLLGSVKTNIGHLEPAAGMAGLIKAIGVLRHGLVPPSLHHDEANPAIGLDGLNLEVVRAVTPLPRRGDRAVVGVSSFGFGGVNAHVVLEEYPPRGPVAPLPEGGPSVAPLVLSARTPAALRDTARRTAQWLRQEQPSWYELAYTAALRRRHHECRLVVRGADPDLVARDLERFADDEAPDSIIAGDVISRDAKVALVFSGNGSQWPGMGARLLGEDEVFRDAVARVDRIARLHVDWSILAALEADPRDVRWDDTRIAQPLLFALQLGLVDSLAARGLRFGAVVGHSVGEIAAAFAAGVLTLEQAVRVIVERSAAQGRTKGIGGMAAVELDLAQAQSEIADFRGRIEIAAENSPKAVTLAGDVDALAALRKRLESRGIAYRALDLDYAFHSRFQDGVREGLLAGLSDLAPGAATIPFYSTVAGGALPGAELGAEYWWKNVRQPVRFAAAIAEMARAGQEIFIEIGPHPILQGYVRQSLVAAGRQGQPLPTMTRASDRAGALERCVDRAHVLGAGLAFERLLPVRGRVVDLPTYPWQRERHWFPRTPEARGPNLARIEGPLLGARLADDCPVWERQIDTALFPFLADHAVEGSVIFPAAGFIEMALEAARCLFGDDAAEIDDLEIQRPLVLDAGRRRMVRFSWREEDDGFRIESRARMQDEPWSLHVVGRLGRSTGSTPAEAVEPSTGARSVAADEHYAFTERVGFRYGPAFQVVRRVLVEGDAAIVELAVSGTEIAEADRYQIDPTLLDGALQGVFPMLSGRAGRDPVAYLPRWIGRILVHRRASPAYAEVAIIRRGARSVTARCVLRDVSGAIVAELRDLRLQRVDLARRSGREHLLYRAEITPLAPFEAAPPPPNQLAVARDAIAGYSAATRHRAMLDGVACALAGDALIALRDEPVARARQPLLERVLDLAGASVSELLDGDGQWQSAIRARPDLLAELTLIGGMAKTLASTLRDGEARTLAPSGATLDHLFDRSPSLAPGNEAIMEAVRALTATWPSDRPLRVLELGADGGGLTRRLLAVLPPGRFELVVTERDDAAVAQLEARFASQPQVHAARLDLSAPLDEQGEVAAQAYDLVVAGYVLHRFPDTTKSLDSIARLALPGAPVVLAELCPAAWLDLVFGSVDETWLASRRSGAAPRLMTAEQLAARATAARLADVTVQEIGDSLLLAAIAPRRVDGSSRMSGAAEGRTWLISAGAAEETLAGALRHELTRLGHRAIRLEELDHASGGLDFGAAEDWAALWTSFMESAEAPAGLVHLAGAGERPEAADAILDLQQRRCWSVIASLQGAQSAQLKAKPSFVLVSVEALAAAPQAASRPWQAPLIGLGRVIANEIPELRCRIVDLHPDDGDVATLAGALAAEIVHGDRESEVIVGPGRRFGVRLRRADELACQEGEADGAKALASAPGSLDNLRWIEARRRVPGAGELEIAVQAAGLNFRDVMFALGALPDEVLEGGFAGPTLGMEAAGIVTRVGPGVAGFAPGDAVLCFAPAALSTHLVTRSFAAAKLPKATSFAAAATIPAAFFTVCYALRHIARLARGERILVHGAAGGVGIAAIQYARHIGAEIFATAGSDEKRAFVALLGVPEDHIFDSRSLAFADGVMARTGGQGVDVVLNSISGEAVRRSLAVLRPFGRFVELGKTDFVTNARLGLRPFRNNIAYFGVDADQLMAERPALAAEVFREMIELFEQGALRPLPYRVFPRDEIVDAFRHMQQSRHIGKIVVDMTSTAEATRSPAPPNLPLRLDPAATYLVTGGLGGFGLATALFLAAKGARHLCLVSRRGVPDAASAALLAGLVAQGVEIEARACDVADARQVDRLVDGFAKRSRKLRGIVHAAAVFDDGMASNLTAERFRRVLAPKIAGAWALHRATERLELDFFVLYSSISVAIGNPGQASYAAGNAFLDSLAARRRAGGLPATVLSWGPIGDVGYLARQVDAAANLTAKLGARPLESGEALSWLERALAADAPAVIVADVDWRALSGALPGLRSPKFQELIGKVAQSSRGAERADLAALAATLGPIELRDLIVETLAEQVGQILRLPPDKLDPRRSLFDLGMDSLMALELRMSIDERLGIELPAMTLAQDIGILRLAETIRDRLLGTAVDRQSDGSGEDHAEMAQTLLARHSEAIGAGELGQVLGELASDATAGRTKLLS